MENLRAILSNYLIFVIVFALCLVLIVFAALYFGSKSAKKSVYLYGMFMDYSTSNIWSLTLYILNYLLLCYSLATKQSLTLALGIICMLLIIIASLINKNLIGLIINVLIEGVNIAIIYFGSLVDTLRNQAGDNKYLFLQIAIMFAGLMFYTFSTFKFVKDIKRKGEIDAKN